MRFIAALLVALLSLSGLARAESDSPWVDAGGTAVRLISGTNATGNGEVLDFGLHFRLDGDWKVYWRSPGDAGYPPRIDWTGSENFKSAEISWPAPLRFSIFDIETMGYAHEVVLPLKIRPEFPGQPIRLRALVEYLACSDLCIPHEVNLALDIPAGSAASTPDYHLIRQYISQVPGDGSAHGLTIEKALVAADGGTLRVMASSLLPFSAPDVFVEGPEELRFGKPEARISEDGLSVALEIGIEGTVEPESPPLALTLTLIDGERSAEARLETGTFTPEPKSTIAGGGGLSLLAILFFALLGGLILNLMPCVLPVLSIKLLGVIKHGGGDPQVVRLSFVMSALGIIAAFMILAGALIGLKAMGTAIGWGIQFQQPWFLAGMALVVSLFAFNLWGFFEVRVPAWIYDLGEHSSHVHGLGGHFLTGMLATLLATPCSAPFLGTAVGFALARGTGEILAVFLALGIGLALPYILVAARPGLATWLPRPGHWMVTLKRVMGFALFATGIWLVSVLWVQAGGMAAMAVAVMTTAAGAVLYAGHRSPEQFGRVGGAMVAVLAALALLLPGWLEDTRQPVFSEADNGDIAWTGFEPEAIPGLIADGKVVFVDVTAEWCITCQVNKTLVLTRGEVLRRLDAPDVVAMRADWTRPDPGIAAYLESFGRYGIPFNAVYGPKAPLGIALPELLSETTVLEAIARAAR